MIEFNKEAYVALETEELKAAYLVECFGEDEVAKEAAIA